MFGVLSAFRRLVAAINGLSERFEAACKQLDRRGFACSDEDVAPALEDRSEDNSKSNRKTRVS